ncbi:hypothetical protein ACCO45_010684 [Purpureocillium lilacinum]|uniref:Uncharacterized protein n=1 Tax=Purpureocillium lilacinum TaxID=33203 RepID=A0ACC4DI61_PURLI
MPLRSRLCRKSRPVGSTSTPGFALQFALNASLSSLPRAIRALDLSGPPLRRRLWPCRLSSAVAIHIQPWMVARPPPPFLKAEQEQPSPVSRGASLASSDPPALDVRWGRGPLRQPPSPERRLPSRTGETPGLLAHTHQRPYKLAIFEVHTPSCAGALPEHLPLSQFGLAAGTCMISTESPALPTHPSIPAPGTNRPSRDRANGRWGCAACALSLGASLAGRPVAANTAQWPVSWFEEELASAPRALPGWQAPALDPNSSVTPSAWADAASAKRIMPCPPTERQW